MLNFPNLLTLLRLLLIPFIVIFFYAPLKQGSMIACGLFALASTTDWLDGYLARKLNQSTSFGAFLDPVADKMTVAVALIMLVELHGVWWMTVPAIIIVGREIVISALREWMAELGQRSSVAVCWMGKIKTTAQMVAITLLLAFLPDHQWAWIGVSLLYLAAIMTLWSMILYLIITWGLMRKGVQQSCL